MEYPIKPFTKDSLDDFRSLYKKVYGKSISSAVILKKFDTTYLMEGYFGYFAYDNNKPIAFYGIVPVLMRYKNQTEIGAQSVNTMTHPDYTGKGLFTELAKRTYKKAQQAGITFIWGLPNQNSAYGFLNKLGWNSKERMIGFKIRTASVSLQKIPIFHYFYALYLKKVFLKYAANEFPKGSFSEDHVTADRTKEYYGYKLFSSNFVIGLEDCLFWIKIKNGLEIGDIEAPSEAKFQKALEKLKQICKKNGIGEILFQCSPEILAFEWMKNQEATQFESWQVGYKNLNSSFPLENLKVTLGDVDVF